MCLSNILASDLSRSYNTTQTQVSYKQWFTGALLTPNAKTVPYGHPGLEFVLVGSENYGRFDSKWNLCHIPSMWGIAPYFDFQASFNKIIGFELIGSVITNFCQGASFTHLQDTIYRLGFQISNDKSNSWIPDFRILVQEIFPTGKYQKFSPSKKGTDSTGEGSFQTGVHLVVQKLFNQIGKHSFRLRADIGYSVPAPVRVRGINYYGGTSDTSGKVYPGKFFITYIFGEIALNRKCAIALELNYQHGMRGEFSGKDPSKINVASFDELCALPEFQYTLTKNMGLVFGGWFTLAGKNTTAFRGGEVAILVLF